MQSNLNSDIRTDSEPSPAEIRAMEFNGRRVVEAVEKFDFALAAKMCEMAGSPWPADDIRKAAERLAHEVYHRATIDRRSMTIMQGALHVRSFFGADQWGDPQSELFTISIEFVPQLQSAVCLTSKVFHRDEARTQIDWIEAAEQRRDAVAAGETLRE